MLESQDAGNAVRSGTRARLAGAALGAAAVSMPFASLLSFLAFHFLGLFFFTLAGLIFGALAFRWAKPAAPISRSSACMMSAFIVLACWFTSIVVEARSLPGLVAERQLVIRRLPEGMSRDDYYNNQWRFAADRLTAEAWPGGVLGYIRWLLVDGELDLQGGIGPMKVYRAQQTSWWWIGRAIFSVTLLAFGVHSQIKGLVAKPEQTDSQTPIEPVARSGAGTLDSAARMAG